MIKAVTMKTAKMGVLKAAKKREECVQPENGSMDTPKVAEKPQLPRK